MWLWATHWAAWRRPRLRAADIERQLWPAQTRGRGLRLTEFLRNRLRPRWLRVMRQEKGEV